MGNDLGLLPDLLEKSHQRPPLQAEELCRVDRGTGASLVLGGGGPVLEIGHRLIHGQGAPSEDRAPDPRAFGADEDLPVAEDVDPLTKSCGLHRIGYEDEPLWTEKIPGEADCRRIGMNPVDDHPAGAVGEQGGADQTRGAVVEWAHLVEEMGHGRPWAIEGTGCRLEVCSAVPRRHCHPGVGKDPGRFEGTVQLRGESHHLHRPRGGPASGDVGVGESEMIGVVRSLPIRRDPRPLDVESCRKGAVIALGRPGTHASMAASTKSYGADTMVGRKAVTPVSGR